MSRAGSIHKDPNGMWSYVVDTAPLGAPRRQVRRRGFRTRRQAQHVLESLEASIDRGEYVEPSRQTLREFMNS